MKLQTIKTVINHPLNKGKELAAFGRLLKRGLAFRLHPYPMIYPFIEKTQLVVERGMSSAELQIYTTLYDTEEMLFLMHFLREDATFVDVGANVGVYSVLMGGVSGANIIAFEPVPVTFEKLRRNIRINQLDDKATLYNKGVGDVDGKLYFSEKLDAINHVVDESYNGPKVEVPVVTLQNILQNRTVHAMKIDVEGFEANVINGGEAILRSSELEVLVMETNGLTNQYTYGQDYLHKKVMSYGFVPIRYSYTNRKVTISDGPAPANTIYVKNPERVAARVKLARPIQVGDQQF